MAGNKRREAKGGGGGREEVAFLKYYHVCRELTDAVVVSRDSAETKCNQTITGPTYGADYILEILGQK